MQLNLAIIQSANLIEGHLKALYPNTNSSASNMPSKAQTSHGSSGATSLASSFNKLKIVEIPPEMLHAFHDIYSTNAGAKAINTSLRMKSALSLSSSKVIQELLVRDEHAFDRTYGAGLKANINSVIRVFNDGQSKPYFQTLYKPENTKENKHFRGQGLSEQGLKDLAKLPEDESLYFSQSPLSVSVDLNKAIDFADKTTLPNKLILIITGKSATPNRGPLRVQAEKEAMFSPQASFKFEKRTKDTDGRKYLYLTEVFPKTKPVNRKLLPQ